MGEREYQTQAQCVPKHRGGVCSVVNAETSGRFGEEADGLGGSEAEGLSQDLPEAAGGVREVHGCQTFHSSELASHPLPEGEM